MGCSSSRSADYEPKQKAPKDQLGNIKAEARKENVALLKYMQLMAKVPVFHILPQDLHPIVAANSTKVKYSKGEVIVEKGKVGECLHVLESGTLSSGSSKEEKDLEYFGEDALLHGAAYTDTLKAASDVVLWTISRPKLIELDLHKHLFSREAVCAGHGSTLLDPHEALTSKQKVDPPQEEEQLFIMNALQNYAPLMALNGDLKLQTKALAEVAKRQKFKSGDKVIEQGDSEAKYFYIVETGSFDVYVRPKAMAAQKDVIGDKVLTLQRGACFGELALLYSQPRAATVMATSDGSVWTVGRGDFKRLLMMRAGDKVHQYMEMTKTVEVFKSLSEQDHYMVAEAFEETYFAKDEVIIQQGDVGNVFYVMYEGCVEVVKDGKSVATLDASSAPQFFGERALLNDEPRQATVRVVTECAKALTLGKDVFEIVRMEMKGSTDIKKRYSVASSVVATHLKPFQNAKPALERTASQSCLSMSSLKVLGILGFGGFGKVELCEHKDTGKVYAVKILSKGYVIANKLVENVLNERLIMLSCNSRFIVKLYTTENSEQWLHFFMEPALGGELYVVYSRNKLHGSVSHARFYAAGVVCAFEHLHARYVIYRDLKPENLLLTGRGDVKLTDMGLAKFAIGKSFTTCGTPDYFAPEVIQSAGHTRAVDWWALGILIYELLTGKVPFKGPSDMDMYRAVLAGAEHIQWPPISAQSKDAIKKLLVFTPSERLPMRQGGVKLLKQHAWWTGFDWDAFENGTMKPPFDPEVKDEKNLKQFRHIKDMDAKWLEVPAGMDDPFMDF
eukprot:TRINITY_DN47595_c0_g1_i1.p1 TRINITY_DN47595_c0_g1~~TRINITY_DN47595_c0_g1_i1.p1  ORF type:complete len:788 (-),score=198.12 TRINITY_DN47595_c0_g1_i1:68-2431(-)